MCEINGLNLLKELLNAATGVFIMVPQTLDFPNLQCSWDQESDHDSVGGENRSSGFGSHSGGTGYSGTVFFFWMCLNFFNFSIFLVLKFWFFKFRASSFQAIFMLCFSCRNLEKILGSWSSIYWRQKAPSWLQRLWNISRMENTPLRSSRMPRLALWFFHFKTKFLSIFILIIHHEKKLKFIC